MSRNERKNINLIELPQTNSRLGANSSYTGTLRFATSLSILGKVSGTVSGGELLVVFPDAEIEAEITADFILIAGSVVGTIHANKGVYLYSSSYVRGEIYATTIRMQHGITFEGSCNLLDQERIDIYNFSRSDLRSLLVDEFENKKKKDTVDKGA